MNDTPNQMLERAIEVAVVAHAGQTDKAGEAYILHPLRVMLAVREQGGSIDQQAAAVLHEKVPRKLALMDEPVFGMRRACRCRLVTVR